MPTTHAQDRLAGPAAVRALLTSAPAPQAPARETTEACIALLRATDDGQRVERFLRQVQQEVGPLAPLVPDERKLLERIAESTDPAAREANHARLHLVLGARLDDTTHDAIHALTREMVVCAES
jgi:phage-related baseplate assembly protein